MKKYLMIACLVLVSIFVVTGCTTTKSYTYKVSTGDNIKVKLETNDGYDLKSESSIFKITKDGETQSQGTFLTLDGYNQYIAVVGNDSSSTILDSGVKDGVTYTFYTYNNTEFNYIIKVDDSNTGVLLANNVSEESAKEIFNRLTFTKK